MSLQLLIGDIKKKIEDRAYKFAHDRANKVIIDTNAGKPPQRLMDLLAEAYTKGFEDAISNGVRNR